MGQAINGISGLGGAQATPMGLGGPGGQPGPALVGQFDANGNLIPGTGGVGNPNGPSQGAPGAGGKGAIPMTTPSWGPDFNGVQTHQPTAPGQDTPGAGGKGINPIGNMVNTAVDTANQLPNIVTGGLLQGPTGPGLAGKSAGAQPTGGLQQGPAGPAVGPTTGALPKGAAAPLTGNFQPSRLIDGGTRQPSPTPFNKRPVVGTMVKPNQGIGTIRGAGRGGIMR